MPLRACPRSPRLRARPSGSRGAPSLAAMASANIGTIRARAPRSAPEEKRALGNPPLPQLISRAAGRGRQEWHVRAM